MYKRIIVALLLFVAVLFGTANARELNNYFIDVKPDNNDESLPPSFRTWYYKSFEGIETNKEIWIEVKGDGWQGGEFVLPVYSYNNYKWFRFKREEIMTQTADSDKLYNYTIIKKFEKENIWIARYYPYDIERLDKLEKRQSFKKNCRVIQIGKTAMGWPMKMFIITDNSVPVSKKKAVWIHARTHPSETGSSFVTEGIIDYILKKKAFDDVQIDLKKLVFYIVPMVNIDGVAEGNARITPGLGLDLEREWRFQYVVDKRKISDSSAIEARILNNTINRLIDEGNNFILAINLHSTNSEPAVYPFIFTNFSRPLPEHGTEGDSMFVYHLRFANLVNKFWCPSKVNVRTSYVPTKPMDMKTYPESWWWTNFRDKVVAFTFESAATHTGCNGETVTSTDNYLLGESMAKAIQKYYDVYVTNKYDNIYSEYNVQVLMGNFIAGSE